MGLRGPDSSGCTEDCGQGHFLGFPAASFKALFLKDLPGWGSPHHELEEEPGVLQDQLANRAATHHPLQSQLLVQQLWVGLGSPRATSHPTHTPLRKASLGGCSPKSGWGSEQQEAMQDGMRVDSSPCWALDVGRSAGPLSHGAVGQTSDQPPYCSLYLLHSVSRLRGWQGRGRGLKVRGGPARVAVDGLRQDGMESMEWRSELVMWMGHRKNMEGGRISPRGHGKEQWVWISMNTGGSCYGLDTSPETLFTD